MAGLTSKRALSTNLLGSHPVLAHLTSPHLNHLSRTSGLASLAIPLSFLSLNLCSFDLLHSFPLLSPSLKAKVRGSFPGIVWTANLLLMTSIWYNIQWFISYKECSIKRSEVCGALAFILAMGVPIRFNLTHTTHTWGPYIRGTGAQSAHWLIRLYALLPARSLLNQHHWLLMSFSFCS